MFFGYCSITLFLYIQRMIFLVFLCVFISGCLENSNTQDTSTKLNKHGSSTPTQKQSSSLVIRNGVMKALAPGQSIGAIYLEIENRTDKQARLTYVHSDRSEKIEVHRHIYNDGMMQMRNVPHLSLDPKTTLAFKPGEYHLMAFGMSPAPKVGENFDVVFEFAGFPAQTLNVVVEKP